MQEGWMDRLAIIVPTMDDCQKVRDAMKEMGLFNRLSFNVESMGYWVYLKPVGMNSIEKLKNYLGKNHYRLVTYRN